MKEDITKITRKQERVNGIATAVLMLLAILMMMIAGEPKAWWEITKTYLLSLVILAQLGGIVVWVMNILE